LSSDVDSRFLSSLSVLEQRSPVVAVVLAKPVIFMSFSKASPLSDTDSTKTGEGKNKTLTVRKLLGAHQSFGYCVKPA
jgi:hypothetical protein